MKEEWLFPGAVVPVDVETTAALVAEIKRLIDVVGGLILKKGPDYERGFIDGMQKQMQSSVDKAVNTMAQPPVAKPHEQEPVAWVAQYAHQHKEIDFYEPDIKDLPVGTKLYTSPPPAATQHERTWVNATTWRGLSDDEALECWPGLAMYADCAKFWKNIEANLKKKNT